MCALFCFTRQKGNVNDEISHIYTLHSCNLVGTGVKTEWTVELLRKAVSDRIYTQQRSVLSSAQHKIPVS